jgi:hypothetical protein
MQAGQPETEEPLTPEKASKIPGWQKPLADDKAVAILRQFVAISPDLEQDEAGEWPELLAAWKAAKEFLDSL